MAEQLGLDLPVRPALGRGDFFVTDANAQAVAMIDAWRGWPSGKLMLAGPEGSGKTHLAHVWQAESGARICAAADLADADIPALAAGPLCVEDVQAIAGDQAGEDALFHLHNLILSEGNALLMTAAAPPARLALALPDLKSRVMGTQVVLLDRPDDLLLSALIAKLFADRQLVPDHRVIGYLVTRMSRSFGMASRLVDEIDRTALARHRPVTLPLARDCLARLEATTVDEAL
ncbi:HdaA/DnaA family protein [Roseivivax isoporae]|uniref:Chromosomal replication initiator, DnaA n=1 Tax=Roseivivax isoporae LMG 25204 TaxID=1449351 RepID=X7FAM0_9RHOB|nr:DnaA/Hda family protein [Roseivivax isoporae]ETX29768.1 chromosomal replication initiator, DnaA [Roseivivax isoporae LMG 25204]